MIIQNKKNPNAATLGFRKQPKQKMKVVHTFKDELVYLYYIIFSLNCQSMKGRF